MTRLAAFCYGFGMKQWMTINYLAESLGVGKNVRAQWKFRGVVPHRWRMPLLILAKRRKLRLAAASFDQPKEKV